MENDKGRILLANAVNEIQNLRRSNEKMSLRLKMFDDMMLVLNTRVERGGMCESPDVCWEITKYLEPQKP